MATPAEEPSRDAVSAYREQSATDRLRAARMLLIILLIASPVFAIVDLLLFPAQFPRLLALRAAGGIGVVALLLALGLPRMRRHASLVTVLACALGTGGVLQMMSLTGASESPYGSGLGLIILGVALLMPWPWQWNVLVVAMVASLYLMVASAGQASGAGWSKRTAVNLLATAGTGVIAVLAGRELERRRRREFEARWGMRHALSELTHASELKGEFVAIMSHELRTPLNLVLGYAEMAAEANDLEECRRFANRIRQAGQHLIDLVEETLAVAQIDAGTSEVRVESTPLAEFWTSLEEKCSLLPRAPGVSLMWSPAPSNVDLGTDPRKLTVVLRNLVGNALKYTLDGEAVVRVEARHASIVFTISDTGIGIPAEAQSQIFERFSRIEETSEQFGGLGLGLFIVRRLVQQLGGTIAVTSELGHGSTFTLTLPRTPRTPHTSAAWMPDALPAPGPREGDTLDA